MLNDDEDEGLFGDLGIPEVIVSKKSDRERLIEGAWKLWSEKTDRPRTKVHPRFRSTYGKLLDLKYNNERLMRAVEGAAYLPPQRRDPDDLGRVINALKYNGTESQAIALLDSGRAEVHKWSWQDESEILAQPYDVESACGIPMDMWSSAQHDYAGYLITQMDPDKILEVAEKVKLHIGEGTVFPSEMVRHHRIWGKNFSEVKVANKANRSTYESGVKEAEELEGLDTEVDTAAGRLIIAGCPARLVRQFHLLAPEGYWSKVYAVLDSDMSMSIRDAYKELELEFDGWNPKNRSKPEW